MGRWYNKDANRREHKVPYKAFSSPAAKNIRGAIFKNWNQKLVKYLYTLIDVSVAFKTGKNGTFHRKTHMTSKEAINLWIVLTHCIKEALLVDIDNGIQPPENTDTFLKYAKPLLKDLLIEEHNTELYLSAPDDTHAIEQKIEREGFNPEYNPRDHLVVKIEKFHG